MAKTPAAADAVASFSDLKLAAPLLKAVTELGYESPSPIQAQAIPHLLNGLDLLGHAPTGTGKTAAFALPLLSRLDMQNRQVQVMTLTRYRAYSTSDSRTGHSGGRSLQTLCRTHRRLSRVADLRRR